MSYVLIIESDVAQARRLADLCLQRKLEVEMSTDPLDGLMRALRDEPDVILVEASDAWFGTLPLTEALHRDPRLSSIPLVVIMEDSGNAIEPTYRSFRDLDACTLATTDELEGILGRLCDHHGSPRRLNALESRAAMGKKMVG